MELLELQIPVQAEAEAEPRLAKVKAVMDQMAL
jgi:hypothetical protein